MNQNMLFRRPTNQERAIFNRLFEANFPARNELASLCSNIKVKSIDSSGSLKIISQASGKAPVTKRIPVEAEAKDEDGVVIHILLHVIDGQPDELEIFREDAERIKRMPSPSRFELIVLPAAPT